MTEEVRETTARYASGEEPQAGDVVRCMDTEDSYYEDEEILEVISIGVGCVVLADGRAWDADRFDLVCRADSQQKLATLAAENARLRWAIMGMLRWQWKFYAELHRGAARGDLSRGR